MLLLKVLLGVAFLLLPLAGCEMKSKETTYLPADASGKVDEEVLHGASGSRMTVGPLELFLNFIPVGPEDSNYWLQAMVLTDSEGIKQIDIDQVALVATSQAKLDEPQVLPVEHTIRRKSQLHSVIQDLRFDINDSALPEWVEIQFTLSALAEDGADWAEVKTIRFAKKTVSVPYSIH